jgi:hypothetical protein
MLRKPTCWRAGTARAVTGSPVPCSISGLLHDILIKTRVGVADQDCQLQSLKLIIKIDSVSSLMRPWHEARHSWRRKTKMMDHP